MRPPIDFHSHHGAFGAYGSFTLGHLRTGGGFNVHDGRAPHRGEIHVGFGRPSEGLSVLPFSTPSQADYSAFAAGHSASAQNAPIRILGDSELERQLEWATDTWRIPGFSFRLATPFQEIPDPRAAGWDALRPHLLPAVWAELELDNRASSEDAVVFLGIDAGDAGAIGLENANWVGATHQGRCGIAATREHQAQPYAGFSLAGCFDPHLNARPSHWLGSTYGIRWSVPAGQRLILRCALGWYHQGEATHGLSTRYAYARLWPSLESVLGQALETATAAWETAACRDRELVDLPPARRFLLAHATRGYFGNSQLLVDDDDHPVYVVNEGEYCMMNTLDLSVDQGFFEARWFPWAIREVLDLAADRYSFLDGLKTADDTVIHPGGLSFCHDMGTRNQFSAPGTSSYELAHLEGCFSHMTFEQACNFALIAAQYTHASGDAAWIGRRGHILSLLLESLERREHPLPHHRRGTPLADSSRCLTGSEITTYDSLDPALAQTRENLYTTVKLWAAYLALERLLSRASMDEMAGRASEGARRASQAVASWPEVDGFLPAIADGRNLSAILPAVEGLVYPLWWGDFDAVSPRGRHGRLVERLGSHLRTVLETGLCRFSDGGWRLSSTSDNSWLSKIFLAQVVAERIFGWHPDPHADAAHVSWQAPGSAATGFTDQVIRGEGIGSRYYPRGVTAILMHPELGVPAAART